MKRRKFVFLTIAGGIASVTPFCTARRAIPSPLNTPLFLAAICDLPTIRKIGTDYRASTPDEDRESQLTDLIAADLHPAKDQTRQISDKIKDDFTATRTVTIDGWVISVTEARQCALNSIQLP